MAAVIKPTPVLKGKSAELFAQSISKTQTENIRSAFLVECAEFLMETETLTKDKTAKMAVNK